MARKTTSKKVKVSETRSLRVYDPYASKTLKNSKLVSEVLLDCIKTGDLDSFREVLVGHLLVSNKTKIAKTAGIGRRTLYDLLDPKKKFNPELSTISAVIRALAA